MDMENQELIKVRRSYEDLTIIWRGKEIILKINRNWYNIQELADNLQVVKDFQIKLRSRMSILEPLEVKINVNKTKLISGKLGEDDKTTRPGIKQLLDFKEEVPEKYDQRGRR